MATVPTGKWIEGIEADDLTSRAARKSLAARLSAVRVCLSREMRDTLLEVDQVHQLRVSARRATEALNLFTDFLPRRRARWTAERLKRLRKAAGPARDCDVMIARLKAHSAPDCPATLIEELGTQRHAAEQLIVAAYRRLRKDGKFVRRAQALTCRVRPRDKTLRCDESLRFHPWAQTKLRRRLQKFFDAAPRGASDVESLHRFRIRSKRLRYAMELLAPAFPPKFREEIYPVVESLQNRLGEVNDSRTVCEFLEARLSGTSDPEQVEAQRALLTAWESRLERARADFFDWWTPRRADDLGTAFEEMLADREETAEDIGYTERGNDE